MKSFLIVLTALFLSAKLHAACADNVTQAKSNGVYKHFLQVTGGKTWLKLKRQTDGLEVEAGISGDEFSVLGFPVTVCTNGANSIRAQAGGLSGTVTKLSKGVYKVTAPGDYSGTYKEAAGFLPWRAPASQEVEHDPAACPDLTGTFVFPDEEFGPITLNVVSAKNGEGVPTLSITDADDGAEDLLLLDGQLKKGETEQDLNLLASCHASKVYVYEYQGSEMVRTSTVGLNEKTDLVLTMEEPGQETVVEVGARK